jgi:hypothetical protein
MVTNRTYVAWQKYATEAFYWILSGDPWATPRWTPRIRFADRRSKRLMRRLDRKATHG